MTTSGTTIYQLNRDDLITAALRKLGVLAAGQTPSTEDITNGSQALNMLVARFRTKGMPLWSRKTFTFTPVYNVALYQIGIGKTFNTAYPLHILQAYRQDSGSASKINMDIIPNFNYNMYPTSAGGSPIQLSYQPFVNYGEIRVWPTPDSSAGVTTVTLIYNAPFEYFNAATDTADFPEHWYLPLVYNLSVLLAPEWGIPLDDRNDLKREAIQYLAEAEEYGYEDGSVFMQPGTMDG